jgi:hypothetical protein
MATTEIKSRWLVFYVLRSKETAQTTDVIKHMPLEKLQEL